jgi:hypothetical protein
LPDGAIHLEGAARDVEGDVRAFEGSSEGNEEVGEEIFAIFGDKDPVDIELDVGLIRVESTVHFREK